MECALLDGEQKSETTELMKEKEILDHLNRKIAELEKNIVGEKTKVKKNYVWMLFYGQNSCPKLNVKRNDHNLRFV